MIVIQNQNIYDNYEQKTYRNCAGNSTSIAHTFNSDAVHTEVNWTLPDFVVAGVLLLGAGLMCELVMRKVKKTQHRIAICAALITTLFLIWLELAVGIFGTPFAGT